MALIALVGITSCTGVIEPLPHADPVSAIWPPVPVNSTQFPLPAVVGPVVIPAPLPASALLPVIVVALPAIATWVAVMPEIPLPGSALHVGIVLAPFDVHTHPAAPWCSAPSCRLGCAATKSPFTNAAEAVDGLSAKMEPKRFGDDKPVSVTVSERLPVLGLRPDQLA